MNNEIEDLINMITSPNLSDLEVLRIIKSDYPNFDFNRTYKYYTPLTASIEREYLECAKYLLQNGALPTLLNHKYEDIGYLIRHPLMVVCVNLNTEILKLLIDYGVDINYQDSLKVSALQACICFCSFYNFEKGEDFAKILIKHKINVNSQRENGATALSFAIRKQWTNMVRLLLESGADPSILNENGKDSYNLINELDRDVIFFRKDIDEIIDLLYGGSATKSAN